MNSMKIYACYNITNNIQDLEFWSTNKKLYKEYVSIFGSFMSDKDFDHRVLPLSMYDTFKQKKPDGELKVYKLDSKTSTPFISTDLDLELFNEEDILTELLQLEFISHDIFSHLPPKILASIRHSNYLLYTGGRIGEADSWREHVDLGKLMAVFQSIRYSGDEIIDTNLFNVAGKYTDL